MILVAGATGYLGSEICRRLRAHGKRVRALVRQSSDSAKLDALQALGVEFAYGDLRVPETLLAACTGVEAVITGATSIAAQRSEYINAVDRDGQIHLVDAAQQAGVNHFIYVSFSRNLNTPSPLHTAKRLVEDRIKTSGMDYTILCPSFFMEYWLSPLIAFNPAAAEARIYGSGDLKIAWIALGDVAEFAARSVDQPIACNAAIQLGGPELLSPREVIALFEEEIGRPFTVETLPQSAIEAQYGGTDDPLLKSVMALMLDYAHGDIIDMSGTSAIFGFPLVRVRDYAARTTALQPVH